MKINGHRATPMTIAQFVTQSQNIRHILFDVLYVDMVIIGDDYYACVIHTDYSETYL